MHGQGNENTLQPLYSLIPIEEFKQILGIDDRDDSLSHFCLVTATHTIEQYCKRRLRHKIIHQSFGEWFDLTLYLHEYPVREVLQISYEKRKVKHEIIEPDFYSVFPDCGTDLDIPFEIHLSSAIETLHCDSLRVIYEAGYSCADVPADLKAACLELAMWNFNRYKSKQIGVKQMSNEKLARSNGSGFEMSMPENVKNLLEPYKRKIL